MNDHMNFVFFDKNNLIFGKFMKSDVGKHMFLQLLQLKSFKELNALHVIQPFFFVHKLTFREIVEFFNQLHRFFKAIVVDYCL